MALALYRKYRPRTFAEVIGQEHVTEPLIQALSSGRLNHAYLFSGPRGCGKTSSARILARSLNCDQGPTPRPCGECESCRALAPDGPGSIDVIEIDAASHGGVDDARELRERAFFAPASSRYKIYIIDEAHMVSSAGFNALLKLVEEPPDYVKFVFATTEPEKVLGTIKSRTHHYPFRLIPPGVLRPYLEFLAESEGIAVEPQVFPLVVRAGGGSARDALSVLDQLIAGSGAEGVTYARAVALLGVTDVALIDEMIDALVAGDGGAAFAAIDQVAEAGHDSRRFAGDLLQRFRDLIILRRLPEAAERGLIDAPEDELARMRAQAGQLGDATLSRCADILHEGLVDMRGATSPRLLLELLVARMLLPAADQSTPAVLQRLERLESGAPAPAARTGELSSSTTDSPNGRQGNPPVATDGQTGARAAARQAASRAASRGASAANAANTARDANATAQARASAEASAEASTEASTEVSAAHDAVQTAAESSAAPATATRTMAAAPSAVSTVSSPSSPSSPSDSDDWPDLPAPVSAKPATRASGRTKPSTPDSAAVTPAPRDPAAQATATQPGVASNSNAAGIDAAHVRRAWDEVVRHVGQSSKKAAAFAREAVVRDIDGDTLILVFKHKIHADGVKGDPAPLLAAVRQVVGGSWQVRCEIGGDKRPAAAASTRSRPTTAAKPAPAAPAPAKVAAAKVAAARVPDDEPAPLDEDVPYDPEFDGPPATRLHEGFDPGDEPDLDTDSLAVKQTSEQQALESLSKSFDLEKIAEKGS